MDAGAVSKLWRKRPFEPFRVYMNNGDVYVIRHPELLMICPTYLLIGVPIPNHPLLLCDRVERAALSDIVRLEVLPAATATPSV
jgi:hypothetical protein